METETITLEKPRLSPTITSLIDSTDAQLEERFFSSLAWSHSNESSNDFRSDFFTKPSLPMLKAIMTTSLGDGDMGEDETTNSFCRYIADLVGHDASILTLSGTMGNQVALRAALTVQPYEILTDYRAHIVNWEGGGASGVSGALIRQVVPSNGHHLTLADVKQHATLTDTYYDAPTRVISLENTLYGTIMPLSEMRAISKWARERDPPIHMHLDGARLWEAVAAGAFTLREAGECFDSMQLCFTKGLGAPIGSAVTGSAAFVRRANWARKHLGGSTRQSGVIAAPARAAVDHVFLSGKLAPAQDKARRAAALWQRLGGKLLRPAETNLVWLDLEGSGLALDEYNDAARRFDLKVGEPVHGRLAFHYQITDAAFARLCEFFRAVLPPRGGGGGRGGLGVVDIRSGGVANAVAVNGYS